MFSGVNDVAPAALSDVLDDRGPAEIAVPAPLPALQTAPQRAATAQTLAVPADDWDVVAVLFEKAEVELDSQNIPGAQALAVPPINEHGSSGLDVALVADATRLARGMTTLEVERLLAGDLDGMRNPMGEVEVSSSSQFFPWLLLLLESVIGPEPEFPDLEGDPAETDCSGDDTSQDDNTNDGGQQDESGDTGGGGGGEDTGDGGGDTGDGQ